MRSTFLTACLLALSAVCYSAQKDAHPVPAGRIIGTVIDAEGRPVPNVTVSAGDASSSSEEPEPTPEPRQSSESTPAKDKSSEQRFVPSEFDQLQAFVGPVEVPEATTNNLGEFEITSLQLRDYSLEGESEEYPSTTLSFIDGSPSAVRLTAEVPVAHVVVKLGLKGGIVRGSVTDKLTGKPVNAGFNVFRFDAGHPWQWIVTSGSQSFRFLIPAGPPAALRASAEGYKPVCVFVRVGPGEQKVMNLELEPAPSKPSPTQSATTGCQVPKSETLEPPNP